MKNLLVKNILFLLFLSLNSFSQDGKFTFTIPSPVTTSAGVFKSDGTLVRTLWNNVKYASGSYTKYWDGKDDWGVKIESPDANYQIKVLTNNVNYTWQGTLGNASDNMTGATKHRGYSHCMRGLTFTSDYGYFCTGYSEGSSSIAKFNINTPNIKIPLFSAESITGDINYTATDGKNVYWGVIDAFSANNTFVFATSVSDDTETDFSSGIPYSVTHGKTYPSTISQLNAGNGSISGLTVQEKGPYLFVSRSGLNQVQVLDKKTGTLVQTLFFYNPRGLSMDENDNLWMISGNNTVAKYSVNSNGTLTGEILTLSGLVDPLTTQVSSDGTLISITDAGTSQQVKFFNNSTGASINTLGTAGGYSSDIHVNNNKFYFSDLRGNQLPFIAFQPDGSFWVNDPGNYRVQHYNSGRNFIGRIMSLGSTYSTWVDKNNINRVFAGYLEFAIDYGVQTLTGSTGWTLIKNWGANVSAAFNDQTKIEYPVTLSNGKTYAIMNIGTNAEIIELTAAGKIRFTGILKSIVSYNSHILCSDGSIQQYIETRPTSTYKRYPLTGFDGSGNPVWSANAETLATAISDDNSATAVGNPVVTPRNQIFSTTDKIALFNYKAYANNVGPTFSTGYHLGVMKKGANNNYLFQTEKSTHRDYKGPYPEAGWFDVGNKVSDFAGGNVNIIDKNIITSYHGEFWQDAQTNMYNHYYDNGLAIGQFGTTRPEVGFGNHAAAMMAGNALTPILAKDGNGDLYLYHGDESDHSGVHRWKITGLNTIAEQVITIPFPAGYQGASANYVDLMAGLPFSKTLSTNTNGWTRNPASDFTIGINTNNWGVNTGVLKYDIENSTDLFINFTQPNATTYDVSRDLGTNNVTSSWKISGSINFGNMLNGLGNNAYVEVLDANGKVLTSFYALNDRLSPIKVFGNTSHLLASDIADVKFNKANTFDMSVTNGVVGFTYGGYAFPTTTVLDKTANWKMPKTLRLRFASIQNMPNFGLVLDVSDLKFYKDISDAPPPPTKLVPVANAGADIILTLPANSASLNGSGTDADGSINNYSWSQISGPQQGSILNSNTASAKANNLIEGTYQFELTVTDNDGLVGKDIVQVTVNTIINATTTINLLPAVNPSNTVNGLDYKYYEGNWSVLPAFSSLDPVKKGTANNFDLSLANRSTHYGFSFTGFINVPADGEYEFYTSSDDGSNLFIDNVLVVANDGLHGITERSGTIGLKAGKHAITGLFFQEGGGEVFNVSYEGMGISKQAIPASALYRVSIAKVAPVAYAGPIQIVVLPQNSVILNGSGTDTDGTIVKYEWIQISGPGSGAITSFNAANTSVNSLVNGRYQFQLTVTDNDGEVGQDIVQVLVDKITNAPSGSTLLPAVDPANTVNGLDYKYYEGNWNFLPAFSSLNPVKTGATANFDLSLASRSTDYGFSFTGFINVPADGEYAFYTSSDDGSNLFIDNVLVVANDGLHGITERSGTIGLKAGKHAITGLFFQQGGGEVFEVSYEGMGISKQAIPGSALYRVTLNEMSDLNLLPAVNPSNTVNGLDYNYYEGSWDVLPSFPSLTPVKTGTTANFDLSQANRSNQYGFSFTGFINVPADGVYTFYTNSDDGSNLYIDNILTVENDGLHAAMEKSGAIGLKAGKHAITGLFFQRSGGHLFLVNYEGMGISKQAIPATDLYRITVENTTRANPTVTLPYGPVMSEQSQSKVSVNNPIAGSKFSVGNKLKVYPNPITDFANLSITTTGANVNLSISLYNSLGMLVSFKQLTVTQLNTLYKLNMTGLGKGIYSVMVTFEGGEKIAYQIIKG